MKKLIIILIFLIPIITLGQEKLGNKIYFYGKLKDKIKGRTVVRFNFHNPKVEKYTLDKLYYEGLDPIQWNSMFLPETEYTDEEISNTLNKYKIDNIFFIKIEDVDKGNSTIGMNLTSSSVYYADIELIELVKITVDFYNLNNKNNTKPEWKVIGEASGGSEFSTVTSVSKKIIGRIINGLYQKGAFVY